MGTGNCNVIVPSERVVLWPLLHWADQMSTDRPTEVEVEAYDGRQAVRALAFISPPDLLIPEGMPPADRCSRPSPESISVRTALENAMPILLSSCILICLTQADGCMH